MWNKLDRSSYPLLQEYFAHQTYRLSIYSLPSLIAWGEGAYQAFYDFAGESLILSMEEGVGENKDRYLLMPLSRETWAPTWLYELALATGIRQIRFVPGDYIKTVNEDSIWPWFEIREEKAYADYVYLASDLAELKGNRYARKRNLIHQFARDYLHEERVEIGAIAKAHQAECLSFLEAWCEERNCDGKGAEKLLICEKKAIAAALETIEDLPWRGLYIRIDGEICGFAIMSKLTGEMGVLNFEKAFGHVKGLYQFLDRECARRLFYDLKFINKESDMGIEALAEAKRSYEPVEMVKSFSLTAI
ncbi:MAG TPA: phosphatidylglycerol lysyltransferase domain-containing protein [Syntrophales bacterium]|nr:phosphatidylglycerol lysyltransferase domain-containing protein [Syntrophales bacterium]HOL59655.1 phosphatidylglycerol lysyltransferase domain-containing protein [Syntrophales bacterium]HPO35801.1 phosphatidylglycerol lysyltransferase domain-containing protein [Syntrophales bacterium]